MYWILDFQSIKFHMQISIKIKHLIFELFYYVHFASAKNGNQPIYCTKQYKS